MSLRYREGDATAPEASGDKIIAHVCNDIGGWGRGFVVALSRRWPSVEAAYRDWFAAPPADAPFALGEVQVVTAEPSLSVANMIAQHGIRGRGATRPLRLDALRMCLTTLAAIADTRSASVHMPRIGCGLAGGTWNEIEPLIAATLVASGVDVTVYDLPPD